MKNHTRKLMATALALVGAALATGCSKSPCEKAYVKMTECEKEAIPKEAFMTFCALAESQKDEDFEAMIACVDKPSCDEFKSCGKEQRAEKDVKKVQQAITDKSFTDQPTGCYDDEPAPKLKEACDAWFKGAADHAIAEKKFDQKLGFCYDDKARAEIKAACDTFSKAAYAHLTTTLGEARDGLKVADEHTTSCYDLERFAEAVSAEEKTKAEKFCEELRTAKYVSETLAEAQKALESKEERMPVTCDMRLGTLEELGTEWSKKTIPTLATKCYGELGKQILAAKVESMTYCEYEVKKILEGVKKHSVTAEGLDALVAKAGEKCKE